MRRARRWKAAGVLVLLGLLVLMSPDCTTNRIVLARNSSGPIDLLVRVGDEIVWDGTFEWYGVVYVPYELTTGRAAFDVEVRYTKPRRTARYSVGHVVPNSQKVHFLSVADDAIHVVDWVRPLSIDDASIVKDLLRYAFLFADFTSCVDRDVIRALRGGT